MAIYPPDDRLWVRACRFMALLDDEKNQLSPVKFNLWGAHLATFSAGAASVFMFVGNHLPDLAVMGSIWTPVTTWLTQAHTMHHLDKRERNIQKARIQHGIGH